MPSHTATLKPGSQPNIYTSTAKRYGRIFVLAFLFGAISVPSIMRLWSVDFDGATLVASIAMALGVITLRTCVLLCGMLPARWAGSWVDEIPEVMDWRHKTAIATVLVAFFAFVLFIATTLSRFAFAALNVSWALRSADIVALTAVLVCALCLLLLAGMALYARANAPTRFRLVLLQVITAAYLLVTAHVVDIDYLCYSETSVANKICGQGSAPIAIEQIAHRRS